MVRHLFFNCLVSKLLGQMLMKSLMWWILTSYLWPQNGLAIRDTRTCNLMWFMWNWWNHIKFRYHAETQARRRKCSKNFRSNQALTSRSRSDQSRVLLLPLAWMHDWDGLFAQWSLMKLVSTLYKFECIYIMNNV